MYVCVHIYDYVCAHACVCVCMCVCVCVCVLLYVCVCISFINHYISFCAFPPPLPPKEHKLTTFCPYDFFKQNFKQYIRGALWTDLRRRGEDQFVAIACWVVILWHLGCCSKTVIFTIQMSSFLVYCWELCTEDQSLNRRNVCQHHGFVWVDMIISTQTYSLLPSLTCMCTYAHTYTHTQTHTHTCARALINTNTHKYERKHTYTYTHSQSHTH